MTQNKHLDGVSEADLRAWCNAITVTWAWFEIAERSAKEADRLLRCLEDAARRSTEIASVDVALARAAHRAAEYEARRANQRAKDAWARVPTGARMCLRTSPPRGSEDLRALMVDLIAYTHERGMS